MRKICPVESIRSAGAATQISSWAFCSIIGRWQTLRSPSAREQTVGWAAPRPGAPGFLRSPERSEMLRGPFGWQDPRMPKRHPAEPAASQARDGEHRKPIPPGK